MFILFVAIFLTNNMYNKITFAQVLIVPHGDFALLEPLVLECQVTSFTGGASWSHDYGVTLLTQCFSGGLCTDVGSGNYQYTSNVTGIFVTIISLTVDEKEKTWTCSHSVYNNSFTIPEPGLTTQASTILVTDVLVSKSMSLPFVMEVTTPTTTASNLSVFIGSFFHTKANDKTIFDEDTRSSNMLSSINDNLVDSENPFTEFIKTSFQDSSVIYNTEIITSDYMSLSFKTSLASIETQYVSSQTIVTTMHSEADLSQDASFNTYDVKLFEVSDSSNVSSHALRNSSIFDETNTDRLTSTLNFSTIGLSETILKFGTSSIVGTQSLVFKISKLEFSNINLNSPSVYSHLPSSDNALVKSSKTDELTLISSTDLLDTILNKTKSVPISTISTLLHTDSIPDIVVVSTALKSQNYGQSVFTSPTTDLRTYIETYTKGYTALVSMYSGISDRSTEKFSFQVSEYPTSYTITTSLLGKHLSKYFLSTSNYPYVTDKGTTSTSLSLFTFDTTSNMHVSQILEVSSMKSTDSTNKSIDSSFSFEFTNIGDFFTSTETVFSVDTSSNFGTDLTFTNVNIAVKTTDLLTRETQSFIKYNTDVLNPVDSSLKHIEKLDSASIFQQDLSTTTSLSTLTDVDNVYHTIESSFKFSSISHTLYDSFISHGLETSSTSFESEFSSVAYVSTSVYSISTTKDRSHEEKDFIFITTTSAVVLTIIGILLIMLVVRLRMSKESGTFDTDTNDVSLSNESRSNKRAFSEYPYVGKSIYTLYNRTSFSSTLHQYDNNWKDIV